QGTYYCGPRPALGTERNAEATAQNIWIKKGEFCVATQTRPEYPWKTTYDTTKSKRTTKNSAFQDAMYSQHNSYAEVTW
ncbi:hypothetical protein P4K96_32115, partial [Bacillus cereus]|nr:hypothetical protein [Bacillus cereus]